MQDSRASLHVALQPSRPSKPRRVIALGPRGVIASCARRSLADQLRRAAQSVALNLAESTGHDAGNRRQRIRSAFGSAQETKTALRIARGWRYIDAADAERAYVLADRIAGACWRLLHKR
ncbi:MAG: four helix bundle protein [Sandaracinus sp.]|nr:four helix bundle protein [Sandaracinus sp.]